MAENLIRRQFRYYKLLYPFSINFTSTCANENLHKSLIYRCYIIITMIFITSTTLYEVTNNKLETTLKLFHLSVYRLAYWMYYTITTLKTLQISRKDKIKKLINDFDELDRLMDYKKENLKQMPETAWVAAVLICHGCSNLSYMLVSGVNSVYSFTFVDIACDAEIGCLAVISKLLYSRIKHFNTHLADLLNKRIGRQQSMDILICYIRMLHILKRITKIWHWQIVTALICNFYCATRSVVLLTVTKTEFGFVFAAILIAFHLSIFIRYGLIGHRLAGHFTRVRELAVDLQDSDLDEVLRGQAARIVRLGDACDTKLCVLGALDVDGVLPLRACSAVSGAVILALQLGFNLQRQTNI